MNTAKEVVLVMGASPLPQRYSYMATTLLRQFGHEVIPFGRHRGEIMGTPVLHDFPEGQSIDTVTMYMNANNQVEYYDKILGLKPKRVIFNPGAENPELEDLLVKNNIEPIEGCTLVMLRTGQF